MSFRHQIFLFGAGMFAFGLGELVRWTHVIPPNREGLGVLVCGAGLMAYVNFFGDSK